MNRTVAVGRLLVSSRRSEAKASAAALLTATAVLRDGAIRPLHSGASRSDAQQRDSQHEHEPAPDASAVPSSSAPSSSPSSAPPHSLTVSARAAAETLHHAELALMRRLLIEDVWWFRKLLIGLLLGGGGLTYLLWPDIKKQTTSEVSDVAAAILQDLDVQTQASVLAKAVVSQVLNDPAIASRSSAFVHHLVTSQETQAMLLSVVRDVLRQPATRAEVQGVVDHSASWLMSDPATRGRLLALTQWLLAEPGTQEKLVQLVNSSLFDPRFQDKAAAALVSVGHRALDDPGLQAHAVAFLRGVLADPELKKQGGDYLWSAYKYIVTPRMLFKGKAEGGGKESGGNGNGVGVIESEKKEPVGASKVVAANGGSDITAADERKERRAAGAANGGTKDRVPSVPQPSFRVVIPVTSVASSAPELEGSAGPHAPVAEMASPSVADAHFEPTTEQQAAVDSSSSDHHNESNESLAAAAVAIAAALDEAASPPSPPVAVVGASASPLMPDLSSEPAVAEVSSISPTTSTATYGATIMNDGSAAADTSTISVPLAPETPIPQQEAPSVVVSSHPPSAAEAASFPAAAATDAVHSAGAGPLMEGATSTAAAGINASDVNSVSTSAQLAGVTEGATNVTADGPAAALVPSDFLHSPFEPTSYASPSASRAGVGGAHASSAVTTAIITEDEGAIKSSSSDGATLPPSTDAIGHKPENGNGVGVQPPPPLPSTDHDAAGNLLPSHPPPPPPQAPAPGMIPSVELSASAAAIARAAGSFAASLFRGQRGSSAGRDGDRTGHT